MLTSFLRQRLIRLGIGLFAALGFIHQAHAALFVNSTSATNITATTATLVANVYNSSGVYTVNESFQWGLTSAYGNTGSVTAIGPGSTQSVIENISGLSCGTTYHFAVTYGPDTTFTTSACTVSVSYDANGGSGAPSDGNAYTNGSTVTVSATQPTRSNYVFQNWNTALNGSGNPYAPSATFAIGSSNVTLYAQWLATQSGFTVVATPAALRPAQTSALSVTGGSGTGAVSYAVSSGPCSVSGNTLTANDRGTCVVMATKAADGTYAAASATTTVTVSASLAQAIDQTVRNTVATQGVSAIRTTESQLRNVNEHLTRLSQGFNLDTDRLALNMGLPEPARILLASASNQLPPLGGLLRNDKGPSSNWLGKPASVWAAGDWSFGQMDLGQNQTSKFHTNEVTVGLDVLWAPKTVVGIAASYGKDRTDTDDQGSQVRGQQRALSLYGVTSPHQDWLLDAQLGWGRLAFANSRYSALSDSVFESSRTGDTVFGSLGMRKPFKLQAWHIEPFVRAQYVKAQLGAYDEGADSHALAFDRANINSAALFIGVESFYEMPLADGSKLIPSGKIAYRRNSLSALNQTVSLAQDRSETASVDTAALPQDVYTAGLGVRYVLKRAISASLNWQFSAGSSGYQANVLRAEVAFSF